MLLNHKYGTHIIPPPSISQELGKKGAHLLRKTLFIKITSIKNATLMIFVRDKDKRFIHNYSLVLVKCSFNFRSTVNSSLAKFTVSTDPNNEIKLIFMNNVEIPLSLYSPKNQPTNLIVWDTCEVNNDNFKRNFKRLIKNHNSCMVTLLKTRMKGYLSIWLALVYRFSTIVKDFSLTLTLMITFDSNTRKIRWYCHVLAYQLHHYY